MDWKKVKKHVASTTVEERNAKRQAASERDVEILKENYGKVASEISNDAESRDYVSSAKTAANAGAISALERRRQRAEEYLKKNSDKYKNGKELLSETKNLFTSIEDLANANLAVENYWGQFGSEEGYNDYFNQIKEQERLEYLDIKEARDKKYALEQELNSLRGRTGGTTSIVSSALSSKGGIYDPSYRIETDRVRALQDEINALDRDINLASRKQTNKYLTDRAVNAEDFGEYSFNPIIPEKEYNIYKQANRERDNSAERFMTEDEKAIYNYYFNKVGEEKAEEYLDSIQEDLNFRQAKAIFEGNEDNVLAQLALMAPTQGLEQSKSGFQGALRMVMGDDSYQPVGTYDYLGQMAKEDLADKGFKLPEWMGGQSIGQLAYDLVNTGANMAPSIAVGALTGTGPLAFGASAAGNAYTQKINEGYSKDQATAYGVIIGVSEATLEKVVGAIGFGGKTLASKAVAKLLPKIDNAAARIAVKYGSSMLSEGVEEGLQEVLEPLYRNAAFGENNNLEITEDAIYSALLGALSGGLMEGTPYAISEGINASYQNKINEKYGKSVGEIVTEGLSAPQDSEAYKLAKEAKAKLNAGEELSDEELDVLAKVSAEVPQERKQAVTEASEEKPIVLQSKEIPNPGRRTVGISEKQMETFASKLPNATKDTGKQVAAMYDIKDGVSKETFIKGVDEAYRYGSMNFSLEEMDRGGSFAKDIPSEKKLQAYYMGQRNAETATIVKANEQQKKALSGVKGKVVFEGNAATQIKNDKQRSTIRFINSVLKNASSMEYHIFASYEEDGKRVYKNSEGKVVPAPNGFYDPKNHQIWIDVNAGDQGQGIMLYTLTHEHVHDIKVWSAEHYNELVKITSQAFEHAGKSFKEAVDVKYAQYKKSHPDTTYEDAQEEVVAEAMSGLLSDEKGLREFSEQIQKQDKGLWERIKAWFNDVIARITAAYKGVEPESEEAKLLMEQRELFEHAQKVFAEAVVTAGQNYKNAGVESSTRQVKNADANAKFQARNSDGSQQNQEKDSEGNILSAEQVEFFKDSKVRDEQGNLKVMHHGTDSAGFTVFDPLYSDDAISLFFTDNTDVAGSYSNNEVDSRYDPYVEQSTIKTVEEFNKLGQKFFEDKLSDEIISHITVEKVSDKLKNKFKEDIKDLEARLIASAEKVLTYAEEFYSEPYNNYENADLLDDAFVQLRKAEELEDYNSEDFEGFRKKYDEVMDGVATMAQATLHYFNYEILPKIQNNPARASQLRTLAGIIDQRERRTWRFWGAFEARKDLLEMFEKPKNKDKWVWFTEVSDYMIRNGTKAIGIDPDDDATMFGTEEEVVGRAIKFGESVGMLRTGGNRYDVYLNLENPYIYEGESKFEGTLWSFDILQDWKDEYDVYIMKDKYGKKEFVEHFFDQYEVEQFIERTVTDEDLKGEILETIQEDSEGSFGEIPVKLTINGYWNNLKGPDGSKWNTRKYTQYAKDNGYDGIIFKGIYDNGGRSHFDTADVPSTVAVAFSSDQVKDVDNKEPTKDPDIRYQDRDSASKPRSAQVQRDEGYMLNENKFYQFYSIHQLDIGGRWGSIDEQIKSIRQNGFQGGSGAVNVLPVSSLRMRTDSSGNPIFSDITQRQYAPKKGDAFLLVPRSGLTKDMAKVEQGFKPLDYEIVTADYDYQSPYEMYEKAYEMSTKGTNIKYSDRDWKPDLDKDEWRIVNYVVDNHQGVELTEKTDYFYRNYKGKKLFGIYSTDNDTLLYAVHEDSADDAYKFTTEFAKEYEYGETSVTRPEGLNTWAETVRMRQDDGNGDSGSIEQRKISKDDAEIYGREFELYAEAALRNVIENIFKERESSGDTGVKLQDRLSTADKNRVEILGNKTNRLSSDLKTLEKTFGKLIKEEFEKNIAPNEGLSKRAKDINDKAAKRFMNEVGSMFAVPKETREEYLLPIINEIIDKGPVKSESEGLVEKLYETAYNHTEDYIVDTDPDGAYKNLRNYIRKTPLFVDNGTKADVGDYNTFRKANMGSLSLTSDAKAIPLDGFYDEVSKIAPEVFSGTIDGAEQLYELSSFMKDRGRTESIGDFMPKEEYVSWADESLGAELQNLYDVTISGFLSEATRKEKERTKAAKVMGAMESVKDVGRKQAELERKIKGYETAIAKKKEQISAVRQQKNELLAKAKAERAEAVERVRKADRERMEKAIADIKATERAKFNAAKERSDEQKRAIIEKYQTSIKKATEGRHRTDIRGKIKRVVNELNTLLTKQTKERHIPLELQKPVAAALDILNLDDPRYYNSRIKNLEEKIENAKSSEERHLLQEELNKIIDQRTAFKDKIAGLKKAYEAIRTSTDPFIAVGYNENIAKMIDRVAEDIGDTLLRDMNMTQLQEVYDLYKGILKTVRDANKFFNEEKGASVVEAGRNVVSEIEASGKTIDQISKKKLERKKFFWNNLKPVYAFKKLGSKTLENLFGGILKGQGTWAKDVSEAKDFFERIGNKYGYKKWDKKKTFEFTSNTGKKFSLNLQQMMSLYAYSKRDQAFKHLTDGGFVFDNKETIKKNGKEYVVNTAQAYNISAAMLQQIVGKLSTDQRMFVDEMQKYLSETMGAKGNEVSRAMYDIELFREAEGYFPLKSAKQFLYDRNEVTNETRQLVNSGFTKPIQPGANNPIILTGFMDVWANHVNDMSMYHAFVMPIENFNKVYNFQFGRSEESDSKSVKSAIQDSFTEAANQYIEQLLKDINGGARVDSRESTYKRLVGNWKKAAVFASASVVVQQPSAIGRAFAEINPVYFMAPTEIGVLKHKKQWEQLKKYAPVAVIKEMGYFDTDMGQSTAEFIKGEKTLKDRADDVFGFAPAKADEYTWCAIWDAVKRETKAKHKDLNVNSEEFLKIAGERFTEVIDKTQVYDSVLSRSGNMRSKSIFMQMLTAFMAEPTTSANMVEQAFREAKAGHKKKAMAYINSVGASVVINSLLVSFVYALRDDDEDERFHDKYLEALLKELADGFNPLTYIPLAKDVWSIFQGWDVERVDMSLFKDLYDNLEKEVKKVKELTEGIMNGTLSEEEIKAAFGEILKEYTLPILDTIASMNGIPLKNLRRDFYTMPKNTFKIFNQNQKELSYSEKYLWDILHEAFLDQTPFGNVFFESKYSKLVDGMKSGDGIYLERLKATYKTEEAYNSAIKAAIKEAFISKEISAAQAERFLVKYHGDEPDDATVQVALYDLQRRGFEDVTFSNAKNYKEFCEPYGISEKVYYEFCLETKDIKGDYDSKGESIPYSKTKKIMPYIDELPLTSEQKTAVAKSFGWSDKTIREYKLW